MRIQIDFHKTNAMRYTGHLDLHKAWERAFRRANLPLAYSQGFHPQPKINLACALPLGFTSECELVDIRLEQTIALDELFKMLEPALPPGIQITDIREVELSEPTLQTLVQSVEYIITLLVEPQDFSTKIQTLVDAPSLPRTRRNKKYDLRPLIEDIQILPNDDTGQSRIQVRLAAREGATGRPEEIIDALGYQPSDARYHRIRLYMIENQPDPIV